MRRCRTNGKCRERQRSRAIYPALPEPLSFAYVRFTRGVAQWHTHSITRPSVISARSINNARNLSYDYHPERDTIESNRHLRAPYICGIDRLHSRKTVATIVAMDHSRTIPHSRSLRRSLAREIHSRSDKRSRTTDFCSMARIARIKLET